MTIAKIYAKGSTSEGGNWNPLYSTGDIADLISFSDGTGTGWSLTNNISAGDILNDIGAAVDGTGDASWVTANAADAGMRVSDAVNWTGFTVSGLSGEVEVRHFVSGPTGRIMDVRVNGGTPIALDGSGPNSTTDGRFTVTPVGGEVTIEFKKNSSSSGDAYINAWYIEETPGQGITLDNATRTPGSTISGTTSNFSAEPTTINLADGASPVLAPTLSTTPNGDQWDISADIPDFAAQAKAAGEGVPVQGLIPGTITVTVE